MLKTTVPEGKSKVEWSFLMVRVVLYTLSTVKLNVGDPKILQIYYISVKPWRGGESKGEDKTMMEGPRHTDAKCGTVLYA